MTFVMVKCCVLLEVRTEFLNTIYEFRLERFKVAFTMNLYK
jgi:hypothetical protein